MAISRINSGAHDCRVSEALATPNLQLILHQGRDLVLMAARPHRPHRRDVGGDKVLPYFRQQREENPAMGWRAIRLGLDRPALLKTQARALLKAAAGRELRLMFPMVTEVVEFERAKAIVQREQNHLAHPMHDLFNDSVANQFGSTAVWYDLYKNGSPQVTELVFDDYASGDQLFDGIEAVS